ncbi:MAG: cytochrome c biogenesis heme-transporting ATPase CcmA [Pseudomonadota bacterium]
MLEALDLECQRGDRTLFKGLSFRLEAGQCLLVQGANGAGKTSLLRMLCGLMPPAAGEIRWQGEPLKRAGDDYRRTLLYCGHLNAVKEELTAEENVVAAAALAGRPVSLEAARRALREAGLKGREELPVRVLSQGQKRRVSLARLLLDGTRLWVLDEPLTALDVHAVQWLAGVIDAHLARGGLAVVTSHQEVPLASGAVRSLRIGP